MDSNMSDRIADPWGRRTPYAQGDAWPVRQDTFITEPDADEWIQSASVLHSNGDAMDIAAKDGRIVERSRDLLAEPGGWGRFGFYTSGQLFLEEYYTLAVLGKAGIGTPHMDGDTRLCTATSAAALKASFGTNSQPGSYEDVDHCDAIAPWGP
jgi:hypothetical protein